MKEEKSELRELCPAGTYDVAATETWLEDMARSGWYLTGIRKGRAVFQKTENVECRYRLQPLLRKKEVLDEEREAWYAGQSWAHLGVLNNLFRVWRSEDPNAPELDTDPVVQAEGYRYLKRRMVINAVQSVLLFLAFAAVLLWTGYRSGTLLLDALEEIPGRLTLWGLLLVLGAVLGVGDIRKMRQLLRTLSAGVPLKRPQPYRRQLWLTRTLVALAFILLVVMPVLSGRSISGSSLAGGWSARDGATGAPKAGVAYLDLREVDGGEGKPEYFTVKTKVHELAPRMYRVQQFLPLSEDCAAHVDSTYYRMLTPSLARRLAKEWTQERFGSLGVAPHDTLTRVSASKLDAFWLSRENGGWQYAVALLGRQVLAVQYSGPSNLQDAEEAILNLLESNG